MDKVEIGFDGRGIVERVQEACLQVSRELEELAETSPYCVALDEQDEQLWDAADESEREEHRKRIVSAAIAEGKANACTGLAITSTEGPTVFAIVRLNDDGEWRAKFLDGWLRIPKVEEDTPPQLPGLPLRFNGSPGSYRIRPDGSIEDMDAEPHLRGVWQGIDVNAKAILSIRLDGNESHGPVNEPAMRIAREHDISGMLPWLEKREGPLAVYGDAYVKEFGE